VIISPDVFAAIKITSLLINCPISRSIPPKYALCSQNNSINYKGYSIYKDFQRRKIPSASHFTYENTKNNISHIQNSHQNNITFTNQLFP
jgi:hypothetical protein